MVFGKTVFLSKPFTLTPNGPLRDSHTPSSLSINFQPLSLSLSSSSSFNKSRGFVSSGPISYSNDYSNSSSDSNAVVYEYGRFGASQYPRPMEIQWKKELCNSVQLIGVVAKPVQIKHLPSGKVVAWSRLAVKKSQNETSWINLNFWDELAHVAFQHVEKGSQIYVSGRLVSDTIEGDDGKQQTYYKVIVQNLNFVERNFSSPVTLYDGESNSTTQGTKPKNYAANSTGSVEELWQAFFANPMEWWDNRTNKRSPNYPDFKHKATGESLWVESWSNPPWVKSQLAILDSRMEGLHDQSDSMLVNFMTDPPV
ncbi:PREDICTED: protein OSB1, mitochondrial-like [Ipomoea nil]|uniref:protein OSB1, mitochondrial-like n=1 Tax=Ipomoea nil TaxID=35883 RepID=UPI000901CA84|nr:PREDICTED: protein OSB1, mitochondrial-like [Ipomoea nil]